MTNPEPDPKLERLLHERLKALPERPAPAQLIPNVLQQIAARKAQVWWRKPWLEWPTGMRVLTALLFAGGLVGLWLLDPAIGVLTDHITSAIANAVASFKPVTTLAGTLWGAARLLFACVKPQFLIIAFTLFAVLYASVLALGTLGYRCAMGEKLNA